LPNLSPLRSADMSLRREVMRGKERLAATSFILQRSRSSDPINGIWDAADVQWWWRRPRVTDELELPVWLDDQGPVAAVGLSAWGQTWQTDAFVASADISLEEVWNETITAAHNFSAHSLRLITPEKNTTLIDLALASGFLLSDEISGTTWLEIVNRPRVNPVSGFRIIDRSAQTKEAHPMIGRNGELVEQRLKECSLYDPTLDLAIEDSDGKVAGYALFWFDPVTATGMLEPLRVEENYQRRGLATLLIATGLERLAQKGARRVKVGFESESAAHLYFKAGFVQTSVDRLLTWSSHS